MVVSEKNDEIMKRQLRNNRFLPATTTPTTTTTNVYNHDAFAVVVDIR